MPMLGHAHVRYVLVQTLSLCYFRRLDSKPYPMLDINLQLRTLHFTIHACDIFRLIFMTIQHVVHHKIYHLLLHLFMSFHTTYEYHQHMPVESRFI